MTGDRVNAELVELGDLDELTRHIGRLCSARDWEALVDLRDRCHRALERGKQLWPAAAHAEYRLALEAPAQWAGAVLVPETVIRDGPLGEGSFQRFVPAHFEQHYFTLHEAGGHHDALKAICAFDLLANNADRKGGHCLLDVRGHVWGIDHGLTFHNVPKLRTVIWDYCGEPIPRELVAQLRAIRSDKARVASLQRSLRPLLSDQELDALWQRWDRLLANPCFPQLDPYRNVPWPPF